jgi:hypothetical protein
MNFRIDIGGVANNIEACYRIWSSTWWINIKRCSLLVFPLQRVVLNHLRAWNSSKQHFKKAPSQRNALQGHTNISRLMLRMEIIAACFRNYTIIQAHYIMRAKLNFLVLKERRDLYYRNRCVFTGSKSKYNDNLYLKLKFQKGPKKWYPVLNSVYQFSLHDCQVRSHISLALSRSPSPPRLSTKGKVSPIPL